MMLPFILAALVGVTAGATSLVNRSVTSSSCPTSGPLSCHGTSSNLCCFESPGGLLLQTQFWDTSPSTGPANSWTIHGLWPDYCDSTYPANCDPSRAYTNIGTLLSNQGAASTLSYMNQYWVDINGQNEQFWEHEWAKHGTCMSTLVPSCLPDGSPTGAEAVAFFNTVVNLFQTLPTYQWLANQGITPSASKTYSLSTLQSALQTASGGYIPGLDCNGNSLNGISWYFNLRGSVIDGAFVPISATVPGSCPSSGIKYPLKSGSTITTGSTSPTTTPTGSPVNIPASATIQASTVGGLLSYGTWSTQTLATYKLSGSSGSFTMSTSKGSCGVSGGIFSCGQGASSSFSVVSNSGSLSLAYGGSTAFSSDGQPSGSTQITVYTGNSHSNGYTLNIIST